VSSVILSITHRIFQISLLNLTFSVPLQYKSTRSESLVVLPRVYSNKVPGTTLFPRCAHCGYWSSLDII